MGSDKPKLPRATLEQKIKILDYYQNSQRPQLDTVEKFKNEVAISTSTFNEWVKHEHEYRERYQQLANDFQKNAKRKVKYKYDKINRAMDLLVQQKMERGDEISEPILRGYWQVYAHQFGVDNPKRLIGFSHGWLAQFKKRHGLSRKKGAKDSDLTLTPNERLLSGQAPEESEAISGEKQPSPGKLDEAPTPAQFQPQHSLSFPGQYPIYNDPDSAKKRQSLTRGAIQDVHDSLAGDRPRQAHALQNDQANGESGQSLALAMNISMGPEQRVSAADIEKFIFSIADHFFHEQQYQYPQTVKTYQEFKSLFLSERLIDLRSSKEQPPQLVLVGLTVGAANMVAMLGLGQIPLQEGMQNHLQSQFQSQRHNLQSQMQNQVQSHIQVIPDQEQLGQTHRSRLRSAKLRQYSKAPQNHHHPTQQSHQNHQDHQGPSIHSSLTHLHSSLTHLPSSHGAQSHTSRSSQPSHTEHPNGSHSPATNADPTKTRYLDATMQQLPLPQLLSLHRLHPLAQTESINQNTSQQRDMQQQPALSFPPGDRDAGLDEMFARDGSNRQYGDQWQEKSSLRKIWEQNKIMLS